MKMTKIIVLSTCRMNGMFMLMLPSRRSEALAKVAKIIEAEGKARETPPVKPEKGE